MLAMSEDTFPRQYARTQRLTLGEPRNVVVSPDGRRVVATGTGLDALADAIERDGLVGEAVEVDGVALLG